MGGQGRQRWLRGSAAMEFALLTPFFVLIAFGAFDFANAVQTSMRLERAAKAGAHYLIIQPGDAAGARSAAIAAWPALSTTDVPLPVSACLCAAAAASCTASCPSGLVRTATVTAQRSITPLVLSWLRTRTVTATVRLE